jgi:hypothetical protein
MGGSENPGKFGGIWLTDGNRECSIGRDYRFRIMSALPYSFAIRSAVAGFLLAVAFVSSEGSARAGCGEPMLTLGGHAAHSDGMPDAPKPPCSGPNCSERPSAPPVLPPSAPTKLLSHEEWAHENALLAIESETDPFHSLPVSSGRPVRRSSVPFHPPRSL